MKIFTVLLLVAVLYTVYTESWGVRIPSPARIVRSTTRVIKTGARKVGGGAKAAVRKTGEGLKKTGEGLKKAGEGLKKAGEVTGKHLYKGLRESGKAFIASSSFVSDILDRVCIYIDHKYIFISIRAFISG